MHTNNEEGFILPKTYHRKTHSPKTFPRYLKHPKSLIVPSGYKTVEAVENTQTTRATSFSTVKNMPQSATGIPKVS